jgi:hypothetical protein
MMETGIKLIAKERQEQIVKHGFSLKDDAEYYQDGELVQAALFCLEMVGNKFDHDPKNAWPETWDLHFENKIRGKSDIEKLIVAGALYMAENERLGNMTYHHEIEKIASRIDVMNESK